MSPKRVIYTGNFSINWDYFKGVQGWHIKNMYGMYNYAKKHGADFKVIDNSNRALQNFYDSCRRISGNKSDGWNIGTLSSIYALIDFVNGPYDEFCWLDLDICIRKTYMDIFNLLKPGHLTVEFGDILTSQTNIKSQFVKEFLGLTHNKYCNTSTFLFNKDTAYKIISLFEQWNVKMESLIDSIEFIERLCNFYKDSPHFMSDECLIEGVINTDILPLHCVPKEYVAHVIIPGQVADPTMDVWGFHFASDTKTQIESFQL